MSNADDIEALFPNEYARLDDARLGRTIEHLHVHVTGRSNPPAIDVYVLLFLQELRARRRVEASFAAVAVDGALIESDAVLVERVMAWAEDHNGSATHNLLTELAWRRRKERESCGRHSNAASRKSEAEPEDAASPCVCGHDFKAHATGCCGVQCCDCGGFKTAERGGLRKAKALAKIALIARGADGKPDMRKDVHEILERISRLGEDPSMPKEPPRELPSLAEAFKVDEKLGEAVALLKSVDANIRELVTVYRHDMKRREAR